MKGIQSGLLVVGLCLAMAVGASPRTTSYTYTPDGLIESLDGPRTDVVDVTRYTYDASGNRATMTNALGQVTQYTDYDGAGRLLRMVDPNGLVVSYTYHPRGWRLSQTLGEGTGASTTTYDYDPAGNLIRVTPPSGTTLDFTYDAANRLTAITDTQGNVQRYTLDAMGNRVAEQTENPQGGITQQLSRVYNSLNRLQQQIGADPTRTLDYAYDANGNLTATTDALSRTTTAGYDALDRLISQLDPANGQTGFAYDARDNLTAVTDPRGNTTAYGYNAFDERITQTSPDTGNTSYTYDEAGNLTGQTDARGITVTYAYDALNRLTAVHYPDPDLTVTYTYDQGTHGLGRLSQMHDAAGTTDYAYDQRGNRTSETRTAGPLVTTVGYAYDDADRLVTLIYPSGHRVHYAYDAVGQISRVTLERPDASTQVLADNLQYLPFGPLKTLTYGNGLNLSRSYDLDYRLTGQHIPGLLDDAYAINAVDNITAWYDGLDTHRDQNFDYDALDRLITAQGSYGDLGYTYDANGNRLSRTQDLATDTSVIDLASNRLTEIQGGLGDLFTYDAAGNITTSAKGDFGYDDTNRLVSYSAPGITASYAYNGQGERVSKTVNGLTTHFRYADSQLIGEYDDSGNAIREYVYLNGQPLALITSGSGDGPSTFVVDGQGLSPRPNLLTIVPATEHMTYRDVEGVTHTVLFDDFGSYWNEHLTDDDVRLIYFKGHANVTPFDRLSLSGQVALNATASPSGALTTALKRGYIQVIDADNQQDENHFEAHDAILGDVSWHVDVENRQITLSEANSPAIVFSASAPTDVWAERVVDGFLVITFDIGGPGSSRLSGGRVTGPQIIHAAITHFDATTVEDFELTTVQQVQQGTGEQVLFVHTDHLGAAAKLTDGQANVAWEADRLPFGRVAINTAQLEMPLRFPGQYYDEESGLHYNYFRDYDPATGRYVQSDPIGLAGGLNTYLYANANPLRFVDPLGLRPTVNPKGPDGRPIEHDCETMCVANLVGTSMLASATGTAAGALVTKLGLNVGWQTGAGAIIHAGSSGYSALGYFDLPQCLKSCEEEKEEECE